MELRIIDTVHDEQARFTLKPGDKYSLDSAHFYHALQVKVIDKAMSTLASISSDTTSPKAGRSTSPVANKKRINLQLKSNKGFSEEVMIKDLMSLDLNNGPGIIVTGKGEESLGACIKRQKGELNGTTDLVLLPTLTIKNCLPCYLQIKRTKFRTDDTVKLMEANEETCIYNVDKSEEKQFHTFTNSTNSSTEVQFKFRVDGFIWSEQISLNYNRVEEVEVEIHDRNFDTLKIGMRVQLQDAGYQVTFFAHACLMVETVRLLNND